MSIAVRYCECFVPFFPQSLFAKVREQLVTRYYVGFLCYAILLLFGFIF